MNYCVIRFELRTNSEVGRAGRKCRRFRVKLAAIRRAWVEASGRVVGLVRGLLPGPEIGILELVRISPSYCVNRRITVYFA